MSDSLVKERVGKIEKEKESLKSRKEKSLGKLIRD